MNTAIIERVQQALADRFQRVTWLDKDATRIGTSIVFEQEDGTLTNGEGVLTVEELKEATNIMWAALKGKK